MLKKTAAEDEHLTDERKKMTKRKEAIRSLFTPCILSPPEKEENHFFNQDVLPTSLCGVEIFQEPRRLSPNRANKSMNKSSPTVQRIYVVDEMVQRQLVLLI
ncbi:hypothetical protein RUM43_011327 [Polyplax serrata]|uniref:Uncharacterized protein n=1 Tax=Polyplax serrata TaxID=468196 RepID=A0AAN8NLV7_POLSC